VARVNRRDGGDLAQEGEIIRGCIHARIAAVLAGGIAAAAGHASHQRRPRLVAVAAASALEHAARQIAEEIERRSLRISPDRVDWLGLSYFRKTNRMHVDLLGDSLFDGRCGVALFLAAYAAISGDDTYRDLALAALGPVRRRLRGDQRGAERFSSGMGIGGGTGMGSSV
jgi:lantibiotic modifying enzyme